MAELIARDVYPADCMDVRGIEEFLVISEPEVVLGLDGAAHGKMHLRCIRKCLQDEIQALVHKTGTPEPEEAVSGGIKILFIVPRMAYGGGRSRKREQRLTGIAIGANGVQIT